MEAGPGERGSWGTGVQERGPGERGSGKTDQIETIENLMKPFWDETFLVENVCG